MLLIWTSSELVVGLFVKEKDHQLVKEAATLLRIVSLGLVPLAMVLVFSGALRGAGILKPFGYHVHLFCIDPNTTHLCFSLHGALVAARFMKGLGGECKELGAPW